MNLMKKLNLDSPATKRGLEELVSKREFRRAIAGLATKEELKNLVTKEEIKKLVTKEELVQLERVLRTEIRLTAEETKDEIKEEFGQQLTKTESRILEAIDDFAKETETAREERLIGSHQQAEDRRQLENHERRITTLEEQKFTAPV